MSVLNNSFLFKKKHLNEISDFTNAKLDNNIHLLKKAKLVSTTVPLLEEDDKEDDINFPKKHERQIIVFVVDYSMFADSGMLEKVHIRMKRFCKRLRESSAFRHAEVTVISIRDSRIKTEIEFRPCTEINTETQLLSGLQDERFLRPSPVICAAYYAAWRGIIRLSKYCKHYTRCYAPLVVIFSDFVSYDSSYEIEQNSVSRINEELILDLIDGINKNDYINVLKMTTSGLKHISQDQDKNEKKSEKKAKLLHLLKGETYNLGAASDFDEYSFSEGLYWLYRYMHIVFGVNQADEGDDPFGAGGFCAEISGEN